MKAVSFTSGILITYLFLHLFPEIYWESILHFRASLVFVVVNFTIFHNMEKHIFQHSKSSDQLRKELKEVHAASLFIYHLVMGLVIYEIGMQGSLLDVVLFFIPVLFHTALSSISFSELHVIRRGSRPTLFILSTSSLLGILFASFITTGPIFRFALIGLMIGMLLYTSIVDSIPKERMGRPEYFLLGVCVYAPAIAFLWAI